MDAERSRSGETSGSPGTFGALRLRHVCGSIASSRGLASVRDPVIRGPGHAWGCGERRTAAQTPRDRSARRGTIVFFVPSRRPHRRRLRRTSRRTRRRPVTFELVVVPNFVLVVRRFFVVRGGEVGARLCPCPTPSRKHGSPRAAWPRRWRRRRPDRVALVGPSSDSCASRPLSFFVVVVVVPVVIVVVVLCLRRPTRLERPVRPGAFGVFAGGESQRHGVSCSPAVVQRLRPRLSLRRLGVFRQRERHAAGGIASIISICSARVWRPAHGVPPTRAARTGHAGRSSSGTRRSCRRAAGGRRRSSGPLIVTRLRSSSVASTPLASTPRIASTSLFVTGCL